MRIMECRRATASLPRSACIRGSERGAVLAQPQLEDHQGKDAVGVDESELLAGDERLNRALIEERPVGLGKYLAHVGAPFAAKPGGERNGEALLAGDVELRRQHARAQPAE